VQQQLLQVNRDKSFLLDRLIAYETIEEKNTDSDFTESSDSDSDMETHSKAQTPKDIKFKVPSKPSKSGSNRKRKTSEVSSTINAIPNFQGPCDS